MFSKYKPRGYPLVAIGMQITSNIVILQCNTAQYAAVPAISSDYIQLHRSTPNYCRNSQQMSICCIAAMYLDVIKFYYGVYFGSVNSKIYSKHLFLKYVDILNSIRGTCIRFLYI